MILGKCRSGLGFVGLVVLATACEPASITEARDQLARGGERKIVFELPIVDTVFKVETLLEDSDIDTLAGGLLAVEVEPESLSVGFGEELEFQNVTLDTQEVSFTPAELSVPPGDQIAFALTYEGLASDTILDNIDTVQVHAGVLSVTTQSRLPIPMFYSVTLTGLTQVGSPPLAGGGMIPAAPGDGSYASHTLTFDLAGATLVPDSVRVTSDGAGTVGGQAIPGGLGDSAIVQTGSIATLQIQEVVGVLDPAETPELTVAVEEVEEIPESDIDLGDLEDAVDSSAINHAIISLVIGNGIGAQAVLSAFNLGVVKLDGVGNVPRDGFGNPVFEEDSSGNPILLAVADPGETTLTLTASGTSTVDLDAAPLVDRLVHILLNDERAAIVATGAVAVGDGSRARVRRSDTVSVEVGMTVGLDFTIPTTGVSISRNTVEDGLALDPEDADDLVSILDSASVVTEAVNHTPFGVAVDIAFVEDSVEQDVFDHPDAVVLNTITLDASSVDTQGVVTTASSTTVSIELTPEQARQLTGENIAATVRARLLPGVGGGGRGAIHAADEIALLTQARIVLRTGGGGQ